MADEAWGRELGRAQKALAAGFAKASADREVAAWVARQVRRAEASRRPLDRYLAGEAVLLAIGPDWSRDGTPPVARQLELAGRQFLAAHRGRKGFWKAERGWIIVRCRQGHDVEARPGLERLGRERPRDVRILEARSSIALARSEWEQLPQLVSAGLRLEPKNAVLGGLFVRGLRTVVRQVPTPVEADVRTGRLRRGPLGGRHPSFEHVVRQFPENVDIAIGWLDVDVSWMIAQFEGKRRLGPADLWASTVRARALLRRRPGDPVLLGVLERALDRIGEDEARLVALGQLARATVDPRQRKRVAEQIALIRRRIRIGHDPRLVGASSWMLLELGQRSEHVATRRRGLRALVAAHPVDPAHLEELNVDRREEPDVLCRRLRLRILGLHGRGSRLRRVSPAWKDPDPEVRDGARDVILSDPALAALPYALALLWELEPGAGGADPEFSEVEARHAEAIRRQVVRHLGLAGSTPLASRTSVAALLRRLSARVLQTVRRPIARRALVRAIDKVEIGYLPRPHALLLPFVRDPRLPHEVRAAAYGRLLSARAAALEQRRESGVRYWKDFPVVPIQTLEAASSGPASMNQLVARLLRWAGS